MNIFLQFESVLLYFVLYLAVSLPAKDEEQSYQPSNLSAGFVPLKFSGDELWYWLPTEHACFPGSAM